ncbi:hypothetical protein NQ318_007160 [Aromia moschata]|uniref:RHD domain-containing protein n=1 Tax=Aromia moschata TaxID=1265417 RepID=A0AAV8XPT5_9CUCU|nr:hypothetical protein NQ318_007160 [Aromia moschata]
MESANRAEQEQSASTFVQIYFRPHPHNLVGREGCKRGVCTLEIPTDTMTVHFSNLGIQCVKKKDIEHALRVREEIRVDPFRNMAEISRTESTEISRTATALTYSGLWREVEAIAGVDDWNFFADLN